MPTLQQIMNRARSLRNETALNSISPERAGSIMYDTLAYINEMQLQGANPLLISKIYDSVADMEADPAPVSDLDGSALLPGQLVCIVTGDPDDPEDGLVYRYDGTEDDTSSWTAVGRIGSDPYLEGYLYMGEADPTTDPGAPTQKVFYSAVSAGTYINFGGIVVEEGEVVFMKGIGTSWIKDVTGAASIRSTYSDAMTASTMHARVSKKIASNLSVTDSDSADLIEYYVGKGKICLISGVCSDPRVGFCAGYDLSVYKSIVPIELHGNGAFSALCVASDWPFIGFNIDKETAYSVKIINSVQDAIKQVQTSFRALQSNLNGYSDKFAKSTSYTSGANITKPSTLFDVLIPAGSRFTVLVKASAGISATTSLSFYGNEEQISAVTNASSYAVKPGIIYTYTALVDIQCLHVTLNGQYITANGTLDISIEVGPGGGIIKKNDLLLGYPVDCASTICTKDGDRISSVAYYDSNGNVLRTDAYTYGDESVTEVRTLATGESLTINTNLATLNQTMIWN